MTRRKLPKPEYEPGQNLYDANEELYATVIAEWELTHELLCMVITEFGMCVVEFPDGGIALAYGADKDLVYHTKPEE
jgi:hypothetical protein